MIIFACLRNNTKNSSSLWSYLCRRRRDTVRISTFMNSFAVDDFLIQYWYFMLQCCHRTCSLARIHSIRGGHGVDIYGGNILLFLKSYKFIHCRQLQILCNKTHTYYYTHTHYNFDAIINNYTLISGILCWYRFLVRSLKRFQ